MAKATKDMESCPFNRPANVSGGITAGTGVPGTASRLDHHDRRGVQLDLHVVHDGSGDHHDDGADHHDHQARDHDDHRGPGLPRPP